MVQDEKRIISSLFDYREGKLFVKNSPYRSRAINTRFEGEEAGTLLKSGYRSVSYTIDGKLYRKYTHHIVWFLFNGRWPSLIDHIDRDRSNNKIENLRDVDSRVNSINKGLQSNNTSGVRGISKNKAMDKWEAYIRNNGKRTHLGFYFCIGQAIKERKYAEKELWGDINF